MVGQLVNILFEWLENIDKFDVISVNEKNDIGYFLEVDL